MAEEIKQQSIAENKLFIETELKENERDVEMLENLIDDAKRDLIKTFTNPSYGMIIDNIINVNDWVKDVQQNYDEVPSEMISVNNADLLFQMVKNYCSEKEHKSKRLAGKIQPDLDVFFTQ